jgi:hypothetical protein
MQVTRVSRWMRIRGEASRHKKNVVPRFFDKNENAKDHLHQKTKALRSGAVDGFSLTVQSLQDKDGASCSVRTYRFLFFARYRQFSHMGRVVAVVCTHKLPEIMRAKNSP